MAKWFIRDASNEESGPFTAGEMRRKVEAGEVLPHTMVRKDSNSKFLAAKSYKGLIKEEPNSKADPLLDTKPTVADHKPRNSNAENSDEERSAAAGRTTMPTSTDHQAGVIDQDHPLLETKDTERLSVGNSNPDTVRTELLKTDATRMQFGAAGLPGWLRKFAILYLGLGSIVLIIYIICAVSLS